MAPGDADGVRRAILALADRHEAGTLAVPGLSPAARERISRRGPGGATGRFAAAGSRLTIIHAMPSAAAPATASSSQWLPVATVANTTSTG